MRIVLLRHGLTDKTGPVLAGRTPGVHLNEAGRAQASRVSQRLRDAAIEAIYTSPLERCRETAKPTASSHQLRARPDKRLLEVGYGDWTGQPLPSLAKTGLWRQVQHRPSLAAFPDGESLLAASGRIVSMLEELRQRHTGNVVCVSHADMIKLAVAHYGGLHMDQYQRIVVGPASLSILRFDGSGVQLERLNDTGDLDDLTPTRPKGRKQSNATQEWGHG